MSPGLKGNLKVISHICGFGLMFIIVFELMIGDLTEHEKLKVDRIIPGAFPVVVRVEGNAQIVLGKNLNQYLNDHPNYSLLIPEHQIEKFRTQIKSDIRATESTPNFDKSSDLPWSASFTVQTIAPGKQAFKVNATWDDDWMNVGWYEATDREIFPQYHTHYFGPGLILTYLPIAGVITAVLWLIGHYLIHRSRNRAAPPSKEECE